MDSLLSSQTTLLLAMGMSGYVGLLHLWYTRRWRDPHLWVGLWSAAAVASQAGRLVQLHTHDPLVAVVATRFYAGMAPFLIASLCCFARALSGQPFSRPPGLRLRRGQSRPVARDRRNRLVPLQRDEPDARLVRRLVPRVAGRPSMLVLPVYMAGACGWVLRAAAPIARAVAGRARRAARQPRPLRHDGALVGGLERRLDRRAGQRRVRPGGDGRGTLLPARAPAPAARGFAAVAGGGAHGRAGRQRVALSRPDRERADRHLRLRPDWAASPRATPGCSRSWASRGVTRPEDNVLSHPLGIAAGVAETVRLCLSRGEVITAEHRYTSSWGRTADVRLIVAPLRGTSGAITGALGLVEDISDRRTLEEGLRRSQKLESVGQLAAGIAHEINNPMAFVRTNLAVLREEWHDAQEGAGQQRQGARARRALRRVRGADRRVARGHRAHHRDRPRHARVRARAATIARPSTSTSWSRAACASRARTARALHASTSEYAAVPPVWGSAGQLRQVFVNLLVNGLQAVGQVGSVRIETALEGEQAVVRVSDDGTGVLPEHLDRLFDPFFTTKPAGEGTGLGLYVSHEIVRGHGGEITVSSTPGQGATFEVRLPLAPRKGTGLGRRKRSYPRAAHDPPKDARDGADGAAPARAARAARPGDRRRQRAAARRGVRHLRQRRRAVRGRAAGRRCR